MYQKKISYTFLRTYARNWLYYWREDDVYEVNIKRYEGF